MASYSQLGKVDRDLVDEVAKVWVEKGGDHDGLLICLSAIGERIDKLIEEKIK